MAIAPMRIFVPIAVCLAFGAATPARAAPTCSVRVVKDVRAEEQPESLLKRGSTAFGPVTQIRVDRKTGTMVFCAHGSYCYPSSAFAFSSPCRLSGSKVDDPETFFYDVE